MVKKIEPRITKTSAKRNQAGNSSKITKDLSEKHSPKGSDSTKDIPNKTTVQKEKFLTKEPIKKVGKKITKSSLELAKSTSRKIKTKNALVLSSK